MNKYKLYKVTIEKQFVVVAEAELSVSKVENQVNNIMVIHADTMLHEQPTHILAEQIHSERDLPEGWTPDCLPYSNYKWTNISEDLVNKSIEELL